MLRLRNAVMGLGTIEDERALKLTAIKKSKMVNKIGTMLALSIITSFSVLAQQTTMELDRFNELKVYDRIEVTLVKSSENKAVISGDEQEGVRIVNDNGLLKIRMDLDEFLDGNKTNVALYYTDELSLVDANEGAKITSEGALKDKYLKLRSQEGAQLHISVDARNLDAKAISGGRIWVTGKAPNQEAAVRSGGEYHAKDLSSNQTEVTVFAGGKAFVNSREYVEANVTAGGTIEIYGNPEKVDEDKTFGGSIIMRH